MPARSKFTKDAREKILEVKRIGGPDHLAAAVAGINEDTLRVWLNKGRASDEGMYHDFVADYEDAKAHPQVRALALLQKKLPDSDALLMKYIERQVKGYEPPQPNLTPAQPNVTVIQLSLGGAARQLPAWIEGEVIDAQEIPALSDGGGNADPDSAPSG